MYLYRKSGQGWPKKHLTETVFLGYFNFLNNIYDIFGDILTQHAEMMILRLDDSKSILENNVQSFK